MPHALRSGTAWERKKDDFAYTCDLDRTGWAWEFLRLNDEYQLDYRLNWAGTPLAVCHESGASLYRPTRRFIEAENWGLAFFANPEKSAHETDVFWLPELTRHTVRCQTYPANSTTNDPLAMTSFHGQRSVLDWPNCEMVKMVGARRSVSLLVESGTLLIGNKAVMFGHEGLDTEFRHHAALQILKGFIQGRPNTHHAMAENQSKYLDYLIALDGHLQGRSYREIAAVLYGEDRVGETWTNDTHGFKLKVRRAVAQGLYLMDRGYRELL
jgi:hypothetical protein